ncbi:hypothetical protein HUA76_07160 [Myxococcus sp. CA056]|uniref:hypothetical protein n=1 Tax=Myxococcus sp. CA056 TaxID=2741740 RepID=UPI00157AB34A|nr:hypothetical protein [Myxococcus sp. CA056]NTX10560.1 hypothetical protein [Myxococcus sp. CA056]
MLTIRKNQLSALGAVSEQRFEADLREHLRRHFPEELRALDDAALAAHVREGMSQAKARSLTSRQGLTWYLEVTALHGLDFESRPELRWAAQMLDDADVTEPHERMRRLHLEATRRKQREERNAQTRQRFRNGGT